MTTSSAGTFEPRQLLWEPKDFGRNTGSPWKPFDVHVDVGTVSSAYFQHLLAFAARKGIKATFGDSPAAFANVLVESYGMPKTTPQLVNKLLLGERAGRIDDYLVWVQVLGARILPKWDARKKALPTRLVRQTDPAFER